MDRTKYITYLAGFIEHNPKNAIDWREEISIKLKSPDLLIYCPIKYEAKKTGKPAGEHIKYVIGLKKSGNWELFKEEMSKIWWGIVRPSKNRYEVIEESMFE